MINEQRGNQFHKKVVSTRIIKTTVIRSFLYPVWSIWYPSLLLKQIAYWYYAMLCSPLYFTSLLFLCTIIVCLLVQYDDCSTPNTHAGRLHTQSHQQSAPLLRASTLIDNHPVHHQRLSALLEPLRRRLVEMKSLVGRRLQAAPSTMTSAGDNSISRAQAFVLQAQRQLILIQLRASKTDTYISDVLDDCGQYVSECF